MKEHVAVIGAGVFGAWTAHHLHRARPPGHADRRLGAGAQPRLVGRRIPPDPRRLRQGRDLHPDGADSLPQWKALSAISGLPIFIPAGILFFFPTEEPYVHDSIAAHRKFGLPTEVLTGPEMARRFPMIDFDGITHRPVRAGVRRADGAARGADSGRPLRARGRRVHARRGHSRRIDGGPSSTKSACHRARRVAADRFVFALGPWLPKLFPDVIGAEDPGHPAGSLLFRPARGRSPVPAGRDARLGRFQRRRHVLRLSRPREPRSQIRPRPHGVAGRSRHAGPAPDRGRARRDRRLSRPPLPAAQGRAADRGARLPV